MDHQFIIVNRSVAPGVALIQLNRPKELNALNPQLMEELLDALLGIDRDDQVRAVVLTGNEKAFAAGADIRQMADKTAAEMISLNQFSTWDRMAGTAKPLIAAVSGYALGGGCELAMMCDIIIASDTAQFGQPEIKIGTIPGAGGTQRLTRAVGKSKAMEMILTGRFMGAAEALTSGLVSRVVTLERCVPEAIELASEIASFSPVMVRLAKEAVNQAYEGGLKDGIAFERRNFYLTFSTNDQKEGMRAFVEKRKPDFKGR